MFPAFFNKLDPDQIASALWSEIEESERFFCCLNKSVCSCLFRISSAAATPVTGIAFSLFYKSNWHSAILYHEYLTIENGFASEQPWRIMNFDS